MKRPKTVSGQWVEELARQKLSNGYRVEVVDTTKDYSVTFYLEARLYQWLKPWWSRRSRWQLVGSSFLGWNVIFRDRAVELIQGWARDAE